MCAYVPVQLLIVVFHYFPDLTSFLFPGGNNSAGAHANHLASATAGELERLDWRLAIGEVSMNLRREVADKASREELYSAIRTEMQGLEQRMSVSAYCMWDNGYLLRLFDPQKVILLVRESDRVTLPE
jgi:hypothetical protein